MKPYLPILSALFLALTASGSSASGFPVVDVAHIAANRASSAIDYVQQVLHEANQTTQIGKQVEQIAQLYEQIEQLYTQIEQMDDYLDRFGDPESIFDLAGIDGLLDDLRQATGGLDIEAALPDITGKGMFGFDGLGIYQPISPTISIDGEDSDRDAEAYKSYDATRATIEQYRLKKEEVIERRDDLRGEIAATTEQLRSAETDSEVKKLTGVLLGQQTELQATDRELEMAYADAEARAIENKNQEDAEAEATAEADAKRFEIGNRRDLETYKLDRSPYGW